LVCGAITLVQGKQFSTKGNQGKTIIELGEGFQGKKPTGVITLTTVNPTDSKTPIVVIKKNK